MNYFKFYPIAITQGNKAARKLKSLPTPLQKLENLIGDAKFNKKNKTKQKKR